MLADVMTKPLQGTAFRVMRAELMNCDMNYVDPPEAEELDSIANPKTMSWKSVISTTFKTPQECVGENKNLRTVRRVDTRQHPNGALKRNLGVARLKAPTWRVEASGGRGGREKN
jgi:hypothetical protein